MLHESCANKNWLHRFSLKTEIFFLQFQVNLLSKQGKEWESITPVQIV